MTTPSVHPVPKLSEISIGYYGNTVNISLSEILEPMITRRGTNERRFEITLNGVSEDGIQTIKAELPPTSD